MHLLLARTLKELCMAGLNREKGLGESEEKNREESRTRQAGGCKDLSPEAVEVPGEARWAHGFVAWGSEPDPLAGVIAVSILHR